MAEHVHLGYAVTDYGNQGTTVDHGSVLLEEGMRGGAYVRATRGRQENTLHIVEKYGTDPASARMKANEARHRREQAQKAVEETRTRIMHENEKKIGDPLYSAVDKLRAEVEAQLGVELPGEDRVANQPPAREDAQAVQPLVQEELSKITEDHPDYQQTQAQVEEARAAEQQAQQTVQRITEAHSKEVGKQPKCDDPKRHQIAEEWYSHITSHGIPADQITEADPQQQTDLARWNHEEHQPYMQRAQEEAAAAAQRRRGRSVEEQLRDADPYSPAPGAQASGPDRSGPDLGR